MSNIIDYLFLINFYKIIDSINYNRLLCTCKNYYYDTIYANNDNIYAYYLLKKFSTNFIKNAKQVILNYYDCFKRIMLFEKQLLSYDLKLWYEEDYYNFWKIKYDFSPLTN